MYNGIKRDCDRPRGRADNHVISGPYSIVAARLTQDESTVVVSVVGLSRASHSRTLPHALAQAHAHGHTGPHARTRKSIHALTHTHTHTDRHKRARALTSTRTQARRTNCLGRARACAAGRQAGGGVDFSDYIVDGRHGLYAGAAHTHNSPPRRVRTYACLHVCGATVVAVVPLGSRRR